MADMTAAELYAIVKDWPEGARPPYIEYVNEQRGQGWFDDDSYVAVSVAILAHVASAVEWLADTTAFLPAISGHKEVGFVLTNEMNRGLDRSIDDDSVFRGPTLLHALDAAVRAVGGGG